MTEPVETQKPVNRSRWKLRLLLLGIVVLGVIVWWAADHFLGGNFHAVVEGQVYRSAQPSPSQLEAWTRKYGLKTVACLRGKTDKDQNEDQTAKDLGLVFFDKEVRCSAEDLPSALWARKMVDILEKAPRPILIHCAAGADRTGVASVMAAMAVGGQSYKDARSQLSIRYGHVNDNQNYIGGFLLAYEEYCRQNHLDTGGWAQFKDWATQTYYPHYYHVEITAPAKFDALADKRTPVDLTIVNRSGETIPAGTAGKKFSLVCYAGDAQEEKPDAEFGRVPLKKEISAGQSVKVRFLTKAKLNPGRYEVHFDLIEEKKTWFGRQGSPVPTCTLIVAPASKPTTSQASNQPSGEQQSQPATASQPASYPATNVSNN